jgi:hypothetical protein
MATTALSKHPNNQWGMGSWVREWGRERAWAWVAGGGNGRGHGWSGEGAAEGVGDWVREGAGGGGRHGCGWSGKGAVRGSEVAQYLI